jgi:hypothetical protein
MAKINSGAVQRRHEHWRELLGRWRASGLSQAAFCQRHGIAVWKLAWWRKRLASGGGVASAAFVPVKIVPAPLSLGRLEVVLRNGRRLRFAAELDPARLTAMVAPLEAISPARAECSTC